MQSACMSTGGRIGDWRWRFRSILSDAHCMELACSLNRWFGGADVACGK
jgi:hypothetical protein